MVEGSSPLGGATTAQRLAATRSDSGLRFASIRFWLQRLELPQFAGILSDFCTDWKWMVPGSSPSAGASSREAQLLEFSGGCAFFVLAAALGAPMWCPELPGNTLCCRYKPEGADRLRDRPLYADFQLLDTDIQTPY